MEEAGWYLCLSLTQLILQALSTGVKQCRPQKSWISSCAVSNSPPVSSTQPGFHPHQSNCSMFYESFANSNVTCECQCLHSNMYFDIISQTCLRFQKGVLLNCSMEAQYSSFSFTVSTTGNKSLPLYNLTGFDNTTVENISLNDSFVSTTTSTEMEYSKTNRTQWRNNSYHRLKETNKKSLNSHESFPKNLTENRVLLPQRRIMFFTVEDKPAFPTWAISMLVFIGVLFLLGVILYLYH